MAFAAVIARRRRTRKWCGWGKRRTAAVSRDRSSRRCPSGRDAIAPVRAASRSAHRARLPRGPWRCAQLLPDLARDGCSCRRKRPARRTRNMRRRMPCTHRRLVVHRGPRPSAAARTSASVRCGAGLALAGCSRGRTTRGARHPVPLGTAHGGSGIVSGSAGTQAERGRPASAEASLR